MGDIYNFVNCLNQAVRVATFRSDFLILIIDYKHINFLSGMFDWYTIVTNRINYTSIGYMVTTLPIGVFECKIVEQNIAVHL